MQKHDHVCLGPDLGDIDGINQWSAIYGSGKSNRTGFLVNIDQTSRNAAIRLGKWKLFQGKFVLRLKSYYVLTILKCLPRNYNRIEIITA